ncbi:MAG: InlB B-repeat-containing protein, partial [Clostridia bacterium]|nr:InlB B-repeat-containing protein [Clostridia bacterium]
MNNKKIIKTLVFSIIIVAMLLSLASCGLFGGGNSNNNGNNSGGTVTISIYDATGFTAQDFVNTTTSTFKIPTQIPEKTGYDFEGWYFDDQFQNKLTAGKTVEPKTYTIYAHYVISTLSVKIIDEFNGNQTISVTYGEKLKISNPTCDWYEYAGLYQDEAKTVEFNLETIIKKDYNLYIKWAVANYDVNYIIPEDEGNNNEGNISKYNKDTNFTLLNATGKTGYTFDGWFLDSNYQTSISAINKTTITQSGAINIYAKFICNQAILSKKSSGKVEGNNASFFVKAAADTYSIFDYFDCSKRSTTVLKDSGDNVITNITLAANEDEENNVLHNFTIIITAEDGVTTNTYNLVVTQFSINGVVVTYYMDGDVYDSDEYAKGDNLVLQAAPSDVKDHYEFTYWSTSDVTPTEAVDGQTLTDNLNLYAYLTPVQYNIIYHLGLGVNHPNNPDKYEYSE